MNKHNSFVLGALVAIAGVAVGAGSVLYASTSIAFSGFNPAAAKDAVNPRVQQEGLTRGDVRRRDAGTLEGASYRDRYDLSGEEAEEETHESAPSLSESVLRRRCVRNLSKDSIRYRHCLIEAGEGIEYQFYQRTR
tara:strand:- start:125 stop:532 length:408 start_codon:yes stop_codon:yes gene_type:complete